MTIDIPQKTDNWFVDKLNLYQAANSDNESLKQNFVVRTHEFELIISGLRRKKAKDPLQHELILGRRGSGKSTLLKRLQIELEEDQELAKKYIPVNLAEEQAGIYRLSDLWFEALREISIKLRENVSLREFSSFKNNQAYTRYLYDEIHELLTKKQRKAVLLLDNLDRILENLDEDADLFREILLNYNEVQLIGGSTRLNEHFWKYDKPFYDFFRRHRLEALTFEEIHALMQHWSDLFGIPELKDYATRNKGKIEALRIVTDGLPRTLQFFIEILLQDHNLYGYDYIKKVMDKATPIYQERLNNLSPAHRKIVLELAFIWEAASTKQLVDKCRMESKLISSNLKQLYDYGIVEKIGTNTKNHLYRLSERFFGMWLTVTQGNPDQKRKARFLTVFLETWYDSHELKDLAEQHLQKLQNKELSLDKALVLSKAFSQSKYVTTSQRDEMIEHTLQLAENKPLLHDLPEKYAHIRENILKCAEEKKYEEALKCFQGIENEEDGLKFYGMGYFNHELNNLKEAEKYYLLAIEKGHIDALNNLAILYDDENRNQEAEKYYLLAIEKGDVDALNNLAILYDDENRNQEAEKYYLLAIEKGIVNALNNLANLYKNESKVEEAEKYYLLAIEKGNVNALNNLANLYENESKVEEAEKYYLLAIEKGDVDALNNLANLYENESKVEEAEKYYLLAIEKGHIDALFNLGIFYKNKNRIEEAEKYYLLAIEEGHVKALFNLAILYYNQNRNQEAEKYYLLAIEKGIVNALNNLANLYFFENRKKDIALDLIRKYNQSSLNYLSASVELFIEIWNGIFENVEQKTEKILEDSQWKNIDNILSILLWLEQKQLVLSYFESEKYGKELQTRFTPLYYATLILCKRTEDNLALRIPPEITETVNEIVEEIKEKNAFYAQPVKA